ncbi:MAG TPA: nitroreductase family protein [Micromonosporaceae bacterium]|nr:nitroreductase family protein [Micromonosporaceae bacterium]
MTIEGYSEAALHAAAVAGGRAPSMHNTQPWRFRLRGGAVEVLADRTRALPVADPSGWALRLACGAAAFNARLALAALGRPAQVMLRPDRTDPELMVRLEPAPPRPPSAAEQRLYAAVPRRHSNRAPFWPEPVSADLRTRLVEAAVAEGGWLELLIGLGPVAALAEIAQAANRVLERDDRYQAELAAWTRPDETWPDGVPAAAGGPSPEPQDLLPQRRMGQSPRAPGRDFEPEPLVGVLGTAGDHPRDQLIAGQALQRVLLTATDLGLAVSMLSQPIEVAAAREQLRLALARYGTPQLILRIGYGQPGFPTPRLDPAVLIDRREPVPGTA